MKYRYGIDARVHEIIGQCVRSGMKDAVEWAEKHVGVAESREYRNATAGALLQRMERGEQWTEMATAIVEAVNQMIQRELEQSQKRLDDATKVAEHNKKTLDDMIEAFVKQDDVCKRLAALQTMIDKMLPDRSQGGELNYTQWIRSRGMVMAAALGMTSVGGGSQDKWTDGSDRKRGDR